MEEKQMSYSGEGHLQQAGGDNLVRGCPDPARGAGGGRHIKPPWCDAQGGHMNPPWAELGPMATLLILFGTSNVPMCPKVDIRGYSVFTAHCTDGLSLTRSRCFAA